MGQFQNIQDHIDENANEKSLEKGKRIAKSVLKFGEYNINRETEVAKFRVMGTYFYSVKIENFFGDIKSQCSCPYDWGGICKHQVAGLLFLAEYLENSGVQIRPNKTTKIFAPKPPQKRRSSEPYSIIPYKPLNNELINRHSNHSRRTQTNCKINAVRHTKNNVIFQLQETAFYWNQYGKEYEITFFKRNESLVTTCSCDHKVEKLCPHQTIALSHILHKYGADFFAILEPGFIDRRYEELAEETGIPNETIRDYYEYNVENRSFSPTKKAAGLVNFKDNSSKDIAKILVKPFKKNDNLSLPVELRDSSKSTAMGYVFSFEHPFELELTAITGVPADLGWMKYIKEYSTNNAPLYLEKKDESILSIIAELEKHAEEISYFYDLPFEEEELKIQQFFLKKLNTLFELLQDSDHIFFRPSRYSGKIKKGDLQPAKISPERPALFFELGEEDIFYTLKAQLKIGETTLDLADPSLDLDQIFPQFLFIEQDRVLYLQPSIQQASTILEMKESTPVFKCLKDDFDAFFQQIVKPISANYPIKYDDMDAISHKTVQLKMQERQLYITELGSFILFKPVIVYDHEQAVNIRETNSLFEKQDKLITTFERDKEEEQRYLEFMTELHPEFEKQQFNEFFFIPFTALTHKNWFFNIFEKITEEGISVFGINELKSIQYSPFKATINTHIKSGQDWFDIEIEIAFGDETIKLSDVRKAVIKNERFVQLSDGKMGVLPEEWFNKLQKYFRVGEMEKGELKISKMKFSIIDELFDQIDDQEVIKELQQKRKRLKAFQSIKKVQIPDEITAELRDYQLEGYNWLHFLDEFQWGGILADDMGLGKTLQVLSFLQKQSLLKKATNLAVVPTSLLFNWKNEIQKFAPGLKHLVHHGADRTANFKDFSNYDLVITTYGMVSNDIELLKKIKFNYIVLDESQAIKNPTSKRYKAVCLLKGKNKIAMTGTPIENNTFDLYAQLNFLNPGFLGSQQAFKNDFSKPIDGDGDADRAMELQKLVKPFVLRRTKEQVASELPPKVEDYLYCTMDAGQKQVYEAYRNKYRDYLLNKIEENGLAKSKLFVLEGLLKLRQICDSPALLNDEENYGSESIKIKELVKHITEKTGQHKILIFSQFVKMLRLIEKELNKNAIKYEYLDGQCSPKKRQESVDIFQNDDTYRVFLISLKAGGTGLNLTAADYVYIVDPWWNPAVENQAIDRTHRIGQDKHIIAYRMICKDTIEEKIINLQKKKLKIASDIINTDESFVKSLTKDDISDLFR